MLFIIKIVIICYMEGLLPSEGWQALSNMSSFMYHADKRKQLKIFGQLDAKLDFCEFLIRKQTNKNDYQRFKSKKRKKELNEDLVNALKSLAIDELILYYNTLVEQLVNLTLNVYSPPVIENKSFIICEAYSRTYSLKMWKKKKLRFDRENHIIYAEKDKKIKIYDLSNYLIRKSEKGDYFTLALEAHNNVPLEKSRTAHFGFQYKNTYILWFSSIQKSIQYKQWESLVVSLNKEQLIAKNRETIKEKQWDRLNKTQGNHNVHQDQTRQVVQSAIYIPLSSSHSEDVSLSLETTLKKEDSQPPVNENILTNSFKIQSEIDIEAIIKESFTYKLAHCVNAFPNIQDLQFQLQVEDEVVKKNKLQISFASALLDNIEMNAYNMEDIGNFNKIQLTGAPKDANIYQNASNSNQFKLIYLLPNQHKLQVKAVLEHFLDVSSYRIINKAVSSCLIKAVIYSQNSTINYQQHHPYNRLYRPRQFYYVRNLTRNFHNQFFIIDKSITNSLSLDTDSFHVRGQMNVIYRFSACKDGIKVVASIRVDNGGALAEHQNVSICKKQVLDLALGICEFYSKSVLPVAKIRYYNIQSHSKHPPAPSKCPQIQNEMVLSYQQDPLLEPPPMQPPPVIKRAQKKQHKQSFYRIPRHQVIKDNSLSQSFFVGQQPQEQDTFQMRKSYSPQRKTYIETRSSNRASPEKNEEQEWEMQVEPEWKDEWMVDEENGGFVMKKNPTMKEKEVMKKIIQTVAKKSLLGKNIENMSFPVDILVPESRLERLLNNLSSAPFLLGGISHLNFLQKFMKTVVFSIQVSLLSLHNGKPFDALLGETYQCRFSNEYEGYAEQISVLPSISAILLLGSDFSLSAALKQKFKVTMNSASFENEGTYKVSFGNNDEICFTTPPAILNGMTFSRRQFLLEGKSFHWIQSQNIVLVLHFEPKNTFSRSEDAKKDYFEGTVYEVSPQFMREFAMSKQSPSEVHIVKVLGKVVGRWTKYITFNNQTLQFSSIPLSEMYNNGSPLLSDSSFRLDIQKLRNCDLEQAQNTKDQLEEAQRKDKILREENSNFDMVLH